MKELNDSVFQLPLNFPQTFLPERRLLSKILEFAAAGGSGTKVAIGEKTGIPTGKSTGKVEPIIYYTCGMGLINALKKKAGIWELSLTQLGSLIIQEDPFLSEVQTLWMLHLMLCRRRGEAGSAVGVADPWFALFAEGSFRLGASFKQVSFQEFLTDRYGEKSYLQSLSGVVLRSYLRESCFGNIGALQQIEGELIVRLVAPVDKDLFPVYAAYFYLIWDELFLDDDQISLEVFSERSRFFSIINWDDSAKSRWLTWMSDQGLIQVDRYTGSPVLLRLKTTDLVVMEIYSELI